MGSKVTEVTQIWKYHENCIGLFLYASIGNQLHLRYLADKYKCVCIIISH